MLQVGENREKVLVMKDEPNPVVQSDPTYPDPSCPEPPLFRTESQSTDSTPLKMPPPIRTLVTVSAQVFPSTVRIKPTGTAVWDRFAFFFQMPQKHCLY
jgi:hypothetical protein